MIMKLIKNTFSITIALTLLKSQNDKRIEESAEIVIAFCSINLKGNVCILINQLLLKLSLLFSSQNYY